MRIVILSSARFHLCDLARELYQRGHEVTFLSYLPSRLARRFGLPKHVARSLFGTVAPLLVARRLTKKGSLQRHLDRLIMLRVDHAAVRRLAECDVFIGISGVAVESAASAKRRMGASIWIERGSVHILDQQAILAKARCRRRSEVTEWSVERESRSYAAADVIVVPSAHVKESFVRRGFEDAMLFRNPYGVDLSMFPRTVAPGGARPTILFVGSWSFEKGCDVLEAAWRGIRGARLLHVGPVGDVKLPRDKDFEHCDPVPQWELSRYYGQAHILALPSRQDGFGMVLSQGLASGLRIVSSAMTGGPDLKAMLGEQDAISIVQPGSVVDLERGLREQLSRALLDSGLRNPLGAARDRLSWESYAERYEAELVQRESRRP